MDLRTYEIPKESKSEIKLFKFFGGIYLLDVCVMACMMVFATFTRHLFDDSLVRVLYVLFNFMVAVFLIVKPIGNPNKRNYEVIQLLFKRDYNKYHSLDYLFPDESIKEREGGL